MSFLDHIERCNNADLGQFLPAGTAIVTLQALDPIHVDFTLPQQALSQTAVGQKIVARVDTWPNETFVGEISAINPKVDTATRNVQIRATLANPGERLVPGMFARVSIDIGAPIDRITIPVAAVVANPYGDSVYVVRGTGDAASVESIFVKLGETRGDLVAVVDGLEAGKTVVTVGQNKLRNGVPVKIDNSVVPTTDPTPTPADK